MKSFKDAKGREWTIAVHKFSIERIKAKADVDLLEIVDGEKKTQLFTRLYTNPVAIVDVLWAMCEPDAVKLSITPEDFAEGLVGDVLDAATDALLGDLVDFFPKARRPILGKALGKVKEATEIWSEQGMARLDALDMSALLTESESKSTNSPGSPAPTLQI